MNLVDHGPYTLRKDKLGGQDDGLPTNFRRTVKAQHG